MYTAMTLIGLGECLNTSLCAQAILLVLSYGDPFIILERTHTHTSTEKIFTCIPLKLSDELTVNSQCGISESAIMFVNHCVYRTYDNQAVFV